MARTSIFEVYSRHGGDWALAGAFPEREPAMTLARALLRRGPEVEVEIFEEVVDPRGRDVVSALVFRGNEHAFLNRDQPRRPAGARLAHAPAPAPVVVAAGVPVRIVVATAAAAAVAAAGLTIAGMALLGRLS